MNKSDLWAAYIAKNPHWLTKNITLTPDGLKKLFEQTYDKAHAQGLANGKAINGRGDRDKAANKANAGRSRSADIINDVFGDAFK